MIQIKKKKTETLLALDKTLINAIIDFSCHTKNGTPNDRFFQFNRLRCASGTKVDASWKFNMVLMTEHFFLSFFWVSVNPFCMICTKKSIYIIFPNQIVFFRFFFSFLFNCIVITQMMQKLSTNPWRSRWKNIWKEKCQYLNQFSRLERNEK